ncbi:hypothetical protein PoB_007669200 [Plakobranchus ocellatus]|uniref:Uncharacterized protein n=1 Tax=Plakobranchus ocellatus TaxID=259542 RepID=A0AAV4E0S9_9GAST|nr:hypothetical protein PoB_007669200 [Plakobranchus ocellatus]
MPKAWAILVFTTHPKGPRIRKKLYDFPARLRRHSQTSQLHYLWERAEVVPRWQWQFPNIYESFWSWCSHSRNIRNGASRLSWVIASCWRPTQPFCPQPCTLQVR